MKKWIRDESGRIVSAACRTCGCEFVPTEGRAKKFDFQCKNCVREYDKNRRASNRMLKTKPSHGLSRSVEHMSWLQMNQRCSNPKDKSYIRYGGRGIYVEESWRISFVQFMFDMGPRPDGMTIERINNDGPYAKWNCRWASYRDQALNTRRSKVVTAFGISAPLGTWVPDTKSNLYHRVKKRLKRGWSAEMSLIGEEITIAWG